MIDMKPNLTRALLAPLNGPFPIKLTKLFFQLSLCQQHIFFLLVYVQAPFLGIFPAIATIYFWSFSSIVLFIY